MPSSENTHGAGYVAAVIGVAAALVVVIVGASTIAAVNHPVPKELWAIGGALAGALVGILAPAPKVGRAPPSPADAAASVIEAATKAAARQAKKGIKKSAEAQAAADEVQAVGRAQAVEIHRPPGIAEQAGATPATDAAGRVTRALANKLATPDKPQPAARRVHEAAYRAALGQVKATAAAEAAGPGWIDGVKTIFTEPKVLVPAIIFVVGLGVGIPLGLGMIAAEPCREAVLVNKAGEHLLKLAPSCSYYVTATNEAANVLISLASAAAGALIGMFAKSPGESANNAKPATGAG